MNGVKQSELPEEILDLLVVGGGPGGTAAAFRAKELGLNALVIDFDDLMKRIRDYSKEKLILPSFGGGDRMTFPKGGSIVECLCFEPIDKDAICQAWKDLYQRFAVPARIGLELTALVRNEQGVFEASVWDHGRRGESILRARHVVLAIGRGVPRRFDIPGSTDGVAFRLEQAEFYVGHPACVIGGGTSAAEAVISISNAKSAAADPSSVYWSYRGDRMPRVSKALAEVFFEAYVGNGNIRYYPRSEPTAVVTGEDRREYLAVRIDRRRMDGRPSETSHLEFPKEHCIACIGEDIPETLLASFGIPMVSGGPRGRKRMVVNSLLESAQPNVFLVGDILSQAHFQTEDFAADPASFREVKHRGNIKTALRDGVRVVEIIRQRLAGVSEAEIRSSEAVSPLPPASPVAQPASSRAAPATASGPAPVSSALPLACLVRILPGGIEEEEHPLPAGGRCTIGRRDCDLSFVEDTLLADRHASVRDERGGYYLHVEAQPEEAGASTGVFLRVPSTRKVELSPGDLVRAGRQFLLFEGGPRGFSFTHFDHQGQELGKHPLPPKTVLLGRRAPDFPLASEDPSLSRRQLALTVTEGRLLIKDLKSANGTFLRITQPRLLEHGDRFRVGQQIFALSLGGESVLGSGRPSSSSPPGSAGPPRVDGIEAKPADAEPQQSENGGPAAGSGPSVTFKGSGKVIPVLPGQTLCEAAEAAGVAINAECHSGICGSDPIRILSGQEYLETGPSDEESDTLEDICGLEAGSCRLACMARVKGPVVVELL